MPGVRKFEARLPGVRMPPEYIAALRVFAFQDSVSFAEYVRGVAHDHILERGAAFRTLVNAGKAWLIAYYQSAAVAGQLPGKERRAELERLTWNAVKKAHEFIETEEAAKNTKHRILGLLTSTDVISSKRGKEEYSALA